MDEKSIKRINFLARKQRETGLTPAEKEEQAKLRREYIDAMKASLVGQLQNITVLNSDGTESKLNKK